MRDDGGGEAGERGAHLQFDQGEVAQTLGAQQFRVVEGEEGVDQATGATGCACIEGGNRST